MMKKYIPNISTGIANHKSLRWGLFCYTNSKRGGSHGLFVIFFSDCCSKRYVPFFTFQRKRVKEGLDRLKTSAFLCRLPGDRRLKAKCRGRVRSEEHTSELQSRFDLV